MDGESSFQIFKDRTGGWVSYRDRASVVNTHVPTMEYIHQTFGGRLVAVDKKDGRSKPYFRLDWECLKALELIVTIRPFLRMKGRRAELVANLIKHKMISPKYNKGRPMPQEVVDLRESWFLELSELNHRGCMIPTPTF